MTISGNTPREAAQSSLETTIYGEIEPLECLRAMAYYYQTVYRSIRHLVGDPRHTAISEIGDGEAVTQAKAPGLEIRSGEEPEADLYRLSFEEVRSLRRFINTDLEHLGMEFYLQRVEWALRCHQECQTPPDQKRAARRPASHPCQMSGGFHEIFKAGSVSVYRYEDFLGETQAIFAAIHAHLVSINRAFGDLYYHVADLPFASFTPAGKSEIGHLSSELNRIMRGLIVATHLQPQKEWQTDLISYLLTCRADCQRFFETVPHYYQMHRLRLVVYPLDRAQDDEARGGPHDFPLACLPWSAGVYLDFLQAYQNIAHHTLAVLHWGIRLHARWNFVPRRVLQAIAPIST